jgi:hypothetical protein
MLTSVNIAKILNSQGRFGLDVTPLLGGTTRIARLGMYYIYAILLSYPEVKLSWRFDFDFGNIDLG